MSSLALLALADQAVAQAAGAAAQTAAAAQPNPAAAYEAMAKLPYTIGGNTWMPEPASVTSDGADWMFYAVLGLSIFCFVAITIAVVAFVWKYRHRPGNERPQPSSAHNDTLELTWTIIPTIICVFLFLFGWREYIKLVTPPQHALEIQVKAWKWGWEFTHPNGVKDENLFVPVDTNVRMVMTSNDVLHSFFIPVFRTKQDVVPRRYSFVWFHATKPGVYRIYCAEYCGTDHSQMKRKVIVLPPGEYEKYLTAMYEKINQMPPLDKGKKVYNEKCIACHTVDGTPRVGPSWKGSWGTEVHLDGGETVTFDENYVRESVLEPTKKGRPGFPRSMPSFVGILNEKDIDGVIEYMKSLK
jgi:cytochrome c oxidase subunit 2